MQGAGGFHDQAEADLVKGAEYHQQTGFFVRQFDRCIAFLADLVGNQFAGLVDLKHSADINAFAGAAVKDHDLVLADLADAIDYRDNGAGNRLRPESAA